MGVMSITLWPFSCALALLDSLQTDLYTIARLLLQTAAVFGIARAWSCPSGHVAAGRRARASAHRETRKLLWPRRPGSSARDSPKGVSGRILRLIRASSAARVKLVRLAAT